MWKRTDNKALKAFKRGRMLLLSKDLKMDNAVLVATEGHTFSYKRLGIYHYKRNPDKSLLSF